MIKVGDVFQIPLSSGKNAFGQYVFKDKMGPIIQVFDLITDHTVSIEQLKITKLMFPPVITGLNAAIRSGYWDKIGHFPVENFVYPNFISTFYNQKTGKVGIWYLWDGKNSKRIGEYLPDELKRLEFLIVWDPHDVVHRIETGEYVFPYRDLILHNEYKPQKEQ